MPGDVTLIAVTTPPEMTAVAVAPEPLAGLLNVTVGADVYPAPPAVTLIELTVPRVYDCAVAPTPPPPENVTDGFPVYPDPPAVTLIEVRTPETVAVAVAPVPPPPLKLTVGAEV